MYLCIQIFEFLYSHFRIRSFSTILSKQKQQRHASVLLVQYLIISNMADTPLEESNLAFVGSDEDKAAREAAASLEVHWEGAGEKPGAEIWRVENRRDDNDNPVFGINLWPKHRHGEFYKGVWWWW